MTDRTRVYETLHRKMLEAGFIFEGTQQPHRQKRKEKEYKYSHPLLQEQLKVDGYQPRGEKFYLKPLSDDPDSEIGMIGGKTTPLLEAKRFNRPNAVDTHRDVPAWADRPDAPVLTNLLLSINAYLDDQEAVPEELAQTPDLLPEGLRKQVYVNRYERNRAAREQCLAAHGYSCKVCGFDFEKVYGDLGRGFIHVHHIVPLHQIGRNYHVDGKKDLLPVCPNCHAMLHRKVNGKESNIEALKQIIAKHEMGQG